MASTKKVLLLLLLCAWAISAQGQSFRFSDLFGQANKQKQYYLQQIAAYKVLASELKMGYKVIRHGLGGIAAINTAELNAHNIYYRSLQQPGPQLISSTQVQDMISRLNAIISQFSALGKVTGLTVNEQQYITDVQNCLLKGCNEDMDDLQKLLQAGTFEMTDDQRLARLAQLQADIIDKYQFTQSFAGSVRLLGAQRWHETTELQSLKELQ